MNKKLALIFKLISLASIVVLGLVSIIGSGSDNSGPVNDTANNTLEEGIYDITFTPEGESPYAETVYLKQNGDILSGTICTGFGPEVFYKPSLYGYANGNDVVIRGGGGGINRGNGDIATIENIFSFEIEAFDFMNPGVTTDFGPVAYDGNSISFHNSYLGCDTKTYFNGCDFALHIYGGSITVDTLVPNITGSYTGDALYTKHYNPSFPPLPDELLGNISGTFDVPFDGTPGTFTTTGTVDGMTMTINESDAYFFARYNFDLTIASDGTFSGTYYTIYTYPDEQGTVTSASVSAATGCPVVD